MIDPESDEVIRKFNCIREVNDYLGLCGTNKCIVLFCKGKKKHTTVYGYKWAFAGLNC